MEMKTLQQKIENRAHLKAIGEFQKFIDFMKENEFCRLLKFKDGEEFVPFCDHYNKSPLFQTGVSNEMPVACKYTNLNEVRQILKDRFIERESEELLRKIDNLSEYFDR